MAAEQPPQQRKRLLYTNVLLADVGAMAYSQNDHQRGHSSAVSSVLFSTGNHTSSETRGGSYIYSGDASSFHEWEFRTRMRLHKSRDPDKYSEAMSRVIDGLRGDAFTIAQEVG